MNRFIALLAFVVSTSVFVGQSHAITVALSIDEDDKTLGGLTLDDDDIVAYDLDTGVATMLFDGSSIITQVGTQEEDIEAVHIFDNGNILLSTLTTAKIGALEFTDDELVEYNPSTGTASVFFDVGSLTVDNEDVWAVSIRENGNIVVGTNGSATIGGLTFQASDLVEFDPNDADPASTATLLFDGSSVFADGDSEAIDGAHVAEDGTIILSTTTGATIDGLFFQDDDLVQYDPSDGSATMLLDGSTVFPSGTDIDGLSIVPEAVIPEPSTLALAALGAISLGMRRRQRQG